MANDRMPDPSDPEAVARAEFATSFRGFDQMQVRSYLKVVARELERTKAAETELRERADALQRRVDELEEKGTEELDEAALTLRLGEEMTRVLETARRAAAEKVERADARATEIVADAEAEAERIRSGAQDAVDAEVDAARLRGRELVAEARLVRERMLEDLARRRRSMRIQVEQLRAGRDRLIESHDALRRLLDDVSSELETSLPDAHEAADRVGRELQPEPTATVQELEAEIEAARNAGVPVVAREEIEAIAHAEPAGPLPQSSTDDGGERADHTDEIPVLDHFSEPERHQIMLAEVGNHRRDLPGLPREPVPIVEAPDEFEAVRLVATEVKIAPASELETEATPAAAAEEAEPAAAAEATEPVEAPAPEPADERAHDEHAHDEHEHDPWLEFETTIRVVHRPDLVSDETAAEAMNDDAVEAALVREDERELEAEAAVEIADEAAVDETPVGEAPVEQAAVEHAVYDQDSASETARPDEPEPAAEPEPQTQAAAEPESGPEPVRAPVAVGEPEPARQPVTEAAPERETRRSRKAKAKSPGAKENKVDDLFARIRESRAESLARAHTVLDQPLEAVVGTHHTTITVADAPEPADDVEADAAPEPEPGSDEALFAARTNVLSAVETQMVRKLKRLLSDEQNEVQDLVRRQRGKVRRDEVLGLREHHIGRYVAAVGGELLAAVSAGASFYDPKGDATGADLSALDERIGNDLLDPLRHVLGRGLDEAEGVEDDLLDRVRAAYRAVKAHRAEAAARTVTLAAFSLGVLATRPEGAEVRWAVDPARPCSADCDDNSLAGAVPAGEPFPTGALFPPGHAGCRCLLIPAEG
jgi:cell division septum initiation protein DivIVA